jgi:transcription factor TFIIIB component B''
MQRPKPNVVKATERKDVMISQEKIGATVEKNENESCVDRDVSALITPHILLNI